MSDHCGCFGTSEGLSGVGTCSSEEQFWVTVFNGVSHLDALKNRKRRHSISFQIPPTQCLEIWAILKVLIVNQNTMLLPYPVTL